MEPEAPPASAFAGESPAHHKLARSLALALDEPDVRNDLLQAMRASPVYEGKLHLDTHLRGPGQALASRMAQAAGVPRQEILSLVEESPPLEIYLPVPEHRDAWSGGPDVLVATTLDEVGAPYGVDTSGREVELDADEPPATPTIVLVPAEGFEDDGTPRRPGTTSLRATGPTPGSTSSISTRTWAPASPFSAGSPIAIIRSRRLRSQAPRSSRSGR